MYFIHDEAVGDFRKLLYLLKFDVRQQH